MRHRTVTIGVSVAIVVAFLFFVPVIPMTVQVNVVCVNNGYCPPFVSYSYYGSVSYYAFGVGLTYLPNPTFSSHMATGYDWSPSLPRS
jgi:hypothetical protein